MSLADVLVSHARWLEGLAETPSYEANIDEARIQLRVVRRAARAGRGTRGADRDAAALAHPAHFAL